MSTTAVPALRTMFAALIIMTLPMLGRQALAGEQGALPKPTGAVILTVSGSIARTNAPGRAEFDREMLEALGLETLTTSTSWSDGPQRFEGVRAAALLAAVGPEGSAVRAIALNDYVAEIPLEMLENYPVVLALRQNGVLLTPRDKGPIWIVFPRDDFAALEDPRIDLQWVWQLRAIEVR